MLDFSFSCLDGGSPEGTPTATLDIDVLRETTLTAPYTVYLGTSNRVGFSVSSADPDGIYEPERAEILYIWEIVDSPLSLENSGLLNILTSWKNPNRQEGHEVAFTFNDPGTYMIRCRAYDAFGDWSQTTLEKVVVAADTTYSGTDTIVYSEAENYTGKPTGATEVKNMTELNAAIAAKSAGTYLRVLFRGGETATYTTQIVATGKAGLAVGSYGTGRANIPLIHGQSDLDSALVRYPTTSLKFYDLNMIGEYDAVRERGRPGSSPFWRDGTCDVTYHRIKISGHTLIGTSFPAVDSMTVFSEMENTGWQNMGVYGQAPAGGTKYLAMHWCAIYQHVDAPQGFPGSKNIGAVHGPFRDEETEHVAVFGCSFSTRDGWSQAYGGTGDQPCIRFNSNGLQGVYWSVGCCTCEGGYHILKMRGQDASTQDVPCNIVLDKMVLLGTPETQIHIECHFGGTTFRNILSLELNVPKYSYGILDGLWSFGIDTGEVTAVNQDSEIHVYSNTLVSLLSTANNRYSSSEPTNENVEGIAHPQIGDSAFANFTNNNNIFHAPNQNAAVTTYAPLDLSTALSGFSPTFKGTLESLPIYIDTMPSNVTSPSGTLVLAYADFPDKNDSTQDQAYWQAREAAGDVEHAMYVSNVGLLYSEEGDFTVDFNAGDITFTNTSGSTWNSGVTLHIKLDQSGNQNTIDATFALTGDTAPVCRPTSGSSAIGGATAGSIAYNDFELTLRPLSNADIGAVEATAGSAPQFSSASVNTAGTSVAIVISGGPISGTWTTTGFTVKTNGHRISLLSASEVGDTITLVINDGGPIIDSETVTVSYDGTGDWTNGGTPVDTFTGQAVTNNSAVSADTTFSTNVTLTNQDYTGTSGVDAIVDSYAGTWQSSYEASGSDYQYPIQFRDRGTAKTTVIGVKSYGHASLTLDWEYTYNTQTPRDNTHNIGA